jgi:NAD+--asparagine ADP-ribosyltransferase
MAKFAIFSKGSDLNNLYRIARNDETKNYYFIDSLYTKVSLTDQQYLDLIKKNKRVSYDYSTNQMFFEDINYEQEIINNGLEVKYLDATGAEALRKKVSLMI